MLPPSLLPFGGNTSRQMSPVVRMIVHHRQNPRVDRAEQSSTAGGTMLNTSSWQRGNT